MSLLLAVRGPGFTLLASDGRRLAFMRSGKVKPLRDRSKLSRLMPDVVLACSGDEWICRQVRWSLRILLWWSRPSYDELAHLLPGICRRTWQAHQRHRRPEMSAIVLASPGQVTTYHSLDNFGARALEDPFLHVGSTAAMDAVDRLADKPEIAARLRDPHPLVVEACLRELIRRPRPCVTRYPPRPMS